MATFQKLVAQSIAQSIVGLALLGLVSPTVGITQTVMPPPTETPTSQTTEADRWSRQGYEQYQANQFGAAIASWQQALTLYQGDRNQRQVGKVLNALAAVHLNLGEYAEAATLAQQALTIAQTLPDPAAQALALGNLGIAQQQLGNEPQAVAVYQQALELMQQTRNLGGEAQVLGLLGNVYEALGDYDQALRTHQRSFALARQITHTALMITALNNLGATYTALDNPTAAISVYRDSFAIAQQQNDPVSIAHILKHLGDAHQSLNQTQQALDYYRQSLAVAQHVRDRKLETEVLTQRGSIHATAGELDQALDDYTQAVALAQSLDQPQLLAHTLNHLGGALFTAGQLNEAEQTLRNAIAALATTPQPLNPLDRSTLLNTQTETYTRLLQVLVTQQKYTDALEIAELSRAQAFINRVDQHHSPHELAAVTSHPPNIDQIRAVAQQQNATLVEYALIPDLPHTQDNPSEQDLSLYIWVVQPSGQVDFRSVALPQGSQSLTQWIQQAQTDQGFTSSPSSRTVYPALRQLYEHLIAPIADRLPSNPDQRVIVIPPDALFLVPFAALQDATGRYLIETHTLSLTPSSTLLTLTESRGRSRATPASALVIGNPTMPQIPPRSGQDPLTLPPLPQTQQDAITIARLLGTLAITGDAATETALKSQLEQAHLIDLATYGLWDDRPTLGQATYQRGAEGVSPGIVLAPNPSSDGILTTAEILNLNLQADLVVLRTYRSGLGTPTGEGIAELSQALIAAGANSTLLSLENTPDISTSDLVMVFYQQLLQGTDRAHALRHAMLTVMTTHPEPSHWAPFTLVGLPN